MYRALFVAMVLLAIAGLLIFWLFAQKVCLGTAEYVPPVFVVQEATLRLAKDDEDLHGMRASLANQGASADRPAAQWPAMGVPLFCQGHQFCSGKSLT